MIQQVISHRFFFNLSLLVLFAAAPSATLAQQRTTNQQQPPTYTRPTVLTRPTTPPSAQPAPVPDIDIPDYEIPLYRTQGALIETVNGSAVMEQAADVTFNPASAVKLVTALAALRSFGPEHRFITAVWTDGTLNEATGTITGNLIISGRDPSFHYEHAIEIARELNRAGIRSVTGDLIVAPRFSMNFDWSTQRSGDVLYDTLDASRRSSEATRNWYEERRALGDTTSLQSVPSVSVMGAVYVDSVPPRARLLLSHRSSKLIDVLKVLLCYSNNFMAERIGDTLGGAEGVRRAVINGVGLKPVDVSLASTSGLGVNRVTPRAMMKIFRALRDELAKHKLSPSDIMPVAGIDPGTLQKRYTSYPSRGSVIAKTGTLIRTDGGVSALVGQMQTARGETLLFVIFNQRGNVLRFRESQDALVTQLQSARGGPAAFNYRPLTLSMRLADTELDSAKARKDEYEPAQ